MARRTKTMVSRRLKILSTRIVCGRLSGGYLGSEKKGGGICYVPVKLEGTCGRDDVLLVYASWYELEAVPPNHGLYVVGIGPDSAEVVVRVNHQISIVADETAAKLVAGVDRVSGYSLGDGCCQVCDDIVEAGVVDVVVEL